MVPRVAPTVRCLAGRLLDLALPPECAGCGREGAALCKTCRPVLAERAGTPPGVALGLPSAAPPPLLQLEWCAPYEGIVREAIRRFKYGGERRLAGVLGAAIAERWSEAGRGGDILVHVPVHPSRRRDRGFDQAELIALAAADALRMPACAGLRRTRATARQYALDRAQRAANVAAAFEVPADTIAAVAGRWIVLVDDVTTTGATLAGCASTLLAAEALGVSAITVAREL
jgi:ComF family protein